MRIVHAAPLLFLVACTGASSSELFDDPASGSNDPTEPSPATSPSASSPSTSPGAPPAPPPVTSSSGGTPTEACTPEEEPNDDVDSATAFKSCISGKIDARGDIDYAAFDPPIDATRFSYSFTSKNGDVAVRVLLNGEIPVGGPNGDLPVAPGVTYLVEVRQAAGDATARPSYEVKIAYK